MRAHGSIHYTVGGNMGAVGSVFDPIFMYVLFNMYL